MKGENVKKIIAGVWLVSGLCMLGASDARAEVREGKWTITLVTRGAGMEKAAGEMQEAMKNMSAEEKAMMQQMMGGLNMSFGASQGGLSTTLTQCLSTQSPVPQMEGQEGCKISHTSDGNTVQFEAVCKDSTSSGTITYEENSMRGNIRVRSAAAGGQEVTSEMSGQYLGACD